MNAKAQEFRAWLERERWIILILAAQAVAAILLNYYTRNAWLRDDEVVFFTQGLMLRLGIFPPDPNRPLLYPFILGLMMRPFGLELFWLRLLQVIAPCATTILAYRLARIAAGEKAALITALVFALSMDSLFYSLRFYRETLAALFLLLVLNLAQHMLARPKSLARAIYAGAAAGLLVMIKPEFSTLLLLLALYGLVRAVQTRDFRSHALPWVVCGVMALATVSPAVLAARAVFNEWIFVCVNAGKYYSLSYCGQLDNKHTPPGASFQDRDKERFKQINPEANHVFFSSDPSIPYGERDRWLMSKAMECIRENPGQTLRMMGSRGLGTLFWLDGIAGAWIRKGDYGKGWPAGLVQIIRALVLAADLFMIFFLAPGLVRAWRNMESRGAVLTVVWFVAYYSTAFYRTRLRISAWPVFVLAASAGVVEAGDIIREGTRAKRILLAGWALLCLVLLGVISSPQHSPVFSLNAWRHIKIEDGVKREYKRGELAIMSDYLIRARRPDLFEHDLAAYVRMRQGSLAGADLVELGDSYFKDGHYFTAGFFFKLAGEFDHEDEKAIERIRVIESMKRRVRLDDWKPTGTDEQSGLSVYTAQMPGPILAAPDSPPLDMKLSEKDREYEYNPGVFKDQGVRAYQYAFKGPLVFITQPADRPPPRPESPRFFEYYTSPEK